MSRNTRLLSLAILPILLTLPRSAMATGGTATFNYNINWYQTPDLYYYIQNAPANVCGDLHTFRNGSWLTSPGWVCTDGSGAATKGPWTWSGTPGDQTDESVFIQWPDGSTTTTDHHIWDKSCASMTRTSPGGSPPSSFSGTATDVAWGAGFDSSWVIIWSFFEDFTGGTLKYWDDSTNSYSSNAEIDYTESVSGMPSLAVLWSAPTRPAAGDHVSGHSYYWQTCMWEGQCVICLDNPPIFTY